MEKRHRTPPYEGKKKMFAVLGASGHVGTAVTQYLLQQGQAVTVVLRNRQKAAAWAQRGVSVALVDVHNTDALAQVFAHILQHPVQVEDIPPTAWLAYYKANGFSDKAARSYANMTAIFINQRYDRPTNPVKGATDLASYLRAEMAGCTP